MHMYVIYDYTTLKQRHACKASHTHTSTHTHTYIYIHVNCTDLVLENQSRRELPSYPAMIQELISDPRWVATVQD